MIACLALAASASAQNNPETFEFTENKGQWDKSVLFKGELSSAEFYLRKTGFLVALHNPDELAAAENAHGRRGGGRPDRPINYKPALSGVVSDKSIMNTRTGTVVHSHAYSAEFVGANPNAEIVPDKLQPGFINYLIGNDTSKWASMVKIYGAVMYKNVYPNIDVRYYSENAQLKYDLIVRPGGDPSRIVMKYSGVDRLSIKNRELVIQTSVGEVRELYPYSFQADNGQGRTEVPCKYRLSGDEVRFELGKYSPNATLVIDPSLIFASFTGSKVEQWGFTATPGPDGSLFSGGIVFGRGFPVTPGAYQSNYMGGDDLPIDIGIMKFSANGSKRLYATYLGGSGSDFPHSMISDAQGNLVVLGRTTSQDYPGKVIGNSDYTSIIVTKLDASGSRLIGSLIIGGSKDDGVNIQLLEAEGQTGTKPLLRNYGDDSRSEVNMDWAGNIYVAAQTQSSDFPVTSNAFQPQFADLASNAAIKQDGVVMKINPFCTAITWASFLGGSGQDGAFVLEVSPVNGHVFVGGGTTSSDFPGVQANAKFKAYQGGLVDGFIAEISNDGSQLLRASYVGTGDADIVYGLKCDRKGFPYVMGISRGGKFPTKAVSATQPFYSVPGSSQFIAKFQPDLTDFVYSTVFGSGSSQPNMSPVAFLVDRCENVYVSGWGGWIDAGRDPYGQAGVRGMPISSDAIQPNTDNKDFYFIVIKKNASKLLYGTYFGQTGGPYGEHVDGGTSRYDQQGVIYQAICANCGGGARFPTTPGVVAPVSGARNQCNLAAVKISFNFAGVASGPRAFVNGVADSTECAPFEFTLRDTIGNAVSYIWKFGDGTPDVATTAREVKHTYTSVGSFTVTLIAIDSTSCNVADTAYTHVRLGSVHAVVDYKYDKAGPCTSNAYDFTIQASSNPPGHPFDNDSSFIWDFGDATTPEYAGPTPPVHHVFPGPGVYPVRLTLLDTNFCNSPLNIDTLVRVNPIVRAQFETPAHGCAPYDAVFNNTSLAGQTFDWDFGDGSPISHEQNPTHSYPVPGTFVVRLTAYDPTTCNLKHDTSTTITVSSKPTSAFYFTPVTPIQNKPNIFTNQSIGAVRFIWLFGDGEGVIKNTMDTVLHQYNASGSYNPCLVAINEFGCPDTSCQTLQADILPLLDVPNAFTPGKFGRNATVRVEGFGIDQMSWKIYNRFGQKVFETNNRKSGWDGTFNGQLQPIDVYTYTLDVIFVDGKKYRKTGDITLIR